MGPLGRPRSTWVPRRLDVLIAVPLVVYAQVELAYTGLGTPVAVALSLVITGALLWRGHAPTTVGFVAACTFGLQAVLLDPAPQVMANSLALLVSVYSVFALAGPRAAAPVLLVACFALIVFEADQGTDSGVLGDLVVTAAVSAIGWFVWRRRSQIDDERETANEELRAASARADQAVAEERRRIARELHDVVSHAVTVVVLQARGGRSMLSRDPDQTRAALDAIEESGEEALAEMRRLVTLLREPSLETAPQPGLADLPALVSAASASGGRVDLQISGEAVPLRPGTELTAFRLIQEAVTNALTHAPGTPVAVEVEYGRSTLDVVVTNPMVGAPQSPGGGFGLFGMRERVELYGGVLEYGPDEGIWSVHGTLPYTAGQSARSGARSVPTSRGPLS